MRPHSWLQIQLLFYANIPYFYLLGLKLQKKTIFEQSSGRSGSKSCSVLNLLKDSATF